MFHRVCINCLETVLMKWYALFSRKKKKERYLKRFAGFALRKTWMFKIIEIKEYDSMCKQEGTSSPLQQISLIRSIIYWIISPCHAEQIKMPGPFLIVSQSIT